MNDSADRNITLSGTEFQVEGPDGEVDYAAGATLAAPTCDVNRVSTVLTEVRPGDEYEGPIVLDTAHASGTLVYAPISPTTEIRWPY